MGFLQVMTWVCTYSDTYEKALILFKQENEVIDSY